MSLISFIPDKYREGFKELATIDEVLFTKLMEGFSYSSLVASVGLLMDRVVKSQNIARENLEKIFSSVSSVMSFLEKKESIDEVVEDITNLAISGGIFTENEKDTFKRRFLSLLENKHIYYASKGYALMREHSNVFLSARIISDIRPVFDLDLEANT